MADIEVILIDYGGVLAHHYSQPYQSMLANSLGVSIEESKKLISEKSKQGKLYRKNEISKDEFWDIVTRLSKINSSKVSNDDLQLLWAKTYIIDYRLLNLIKVLRKKVKVYLYSNTDKERYLYMDSTYEIGSFFDGIFCSFETKYMKPSKASINYALHKLRLSNKPNSVLVIDDRVNTCEDIKAFGINTYRFINYEDLLKFFFESQLLEHSDFY